MGIVSGFPQGLGLSVLQNRNTTSHYNTSPVEHEWELPRVASESKEESLLALVNSNYLQTSRFHDFSPFQCGWIFECSNSPLSPSVSRVTGWDEGLQRLKWVWNFSKFLYFSPCFLYKQNFSCCYVFIQFTVSLSSLNEIWESPHKIPMPKIIWA